jgi:hypothetical protein
MKSPQDHWNNLVKRATDKNPDITQHQIDAMKLPFMICYEIISFEFAMEDPAKIAEFAEKLGTMFATEKRT